MTGDESFLRAIAADPGDRVSRLVYADWLDDCGDPRAEFLRVEARLAELPRGDPAAPTLRARRRELQESLPRPWLALVGGLRVSPEEPDPIRAEVAALAVARRAKYTDNRGYAITIEAAALCPLNGRVAFLESRSKWDGGYHDITYTLRLRDPAGGATSWEPESYNPYFGCDTRFMEWWDDAVLFIYREKHHTYLARVGFDTRPDFHAIKDDWVLDGGQLAHIGWRETEVRRVLVPQLRELPPLCVAEARELDLLPRIRWEE